jgi:cytoskeletal protein CcmA (bactofilin family)
MRDGKERIIMFEKKEGEKMEATETVVGSDVVIKGNLKSPSNILVNGIVKGKVKTETDANIGETAKVEGSVEGKNVTIAGEIQGNVTVQESLKVEGTGKITGDISAPSLVIQQGAIFTGKCEMSAGSKEAEAEETEEEKEEEEIEEILETEEVTEEN